MSIKRTIITAIVGLTLVALVAPVTASALTIDELMAQMAVLQAQLLALQQGQGGGTPVSTGSVSCAGITFSRALTVGSTGSDVKCLQVLLNNNGFTLAQTGAGSPGMETSYFGPRTLAVVRAFQVARGWTPANQVGPLTRAALNALINSGTYVPPVVPVAGCPAGAVYNSITGALCATTPTPSTPGMEGSITVTKSVSPISGVQMNIGQSNVAVAAVDVKATNSDVVVNRVDVNFTGISGTSCNVRPWTMISGVTVSDGSTSKSLAVTAANTTEVTVGTTYSLRVEGLNMLVSKDTTKKITLSVDAGSLPVGATTCTPTIQFGVNAVRGTDGAGISQTGPSAALTSSTFVVNAGDTGTLTVSAASDNPKARNIIVSETAQTDNVVLLKFNVEAKSNDVILRRVIVQAYSSSTTLATTMPTVKLLDGTAELASTSTAASSTFGDLTLRIPKGTTKTLTVVGTLPKTDASAISEGDYVNVNMGAADVTGEDASTFETVTAGGADLTGALTYASLKAPTFALVSSSITNIAGTSGSSSQAATAVIRFNVTATGGDIYVRDPSATAASSGIVARQVLDTASASSTLSQTYTTNATDGTYTYKVTAGDTKYFEVSGIITQTEISGFWESMNILNVKWGLADTDTDAAASYNTQTWGLDDIKTSPAYLNPTS